jgi:hypothetical protein
VFGGSDNHTGQPGVQGLSNRWHIHDHLAGWTGVLVESGQLTRDALFDAMLARRTVATTSERILADFRLDDHPMGDVVELVSPKQSRRIEIEVAHSSPVTDIQLMRSGQPIAAWQPNRCVARVEYRDEEPYGESQEFYHVRVRTASRENVEEPSADIAREQGATAWLTPIWVRYEQPLPSPEGQVRQALEHAPNLALNKTVIRSYLNGNTANPGSQWVELEAFGPVPEMSGNGS